ncbi:MAG: Arm DNA-binding domain-containing protein, partial [Pseudomonadota bacterium]
MRVRLNKRAIEEAVYQGPGGCYAWDTEMPGFGVRIYPTSRKSFVVSYWTQGRRRFFTLGTYGKLTLPQAREEALEVFLRVRRGEDPAADRQARRQAPNVADLAERHLREHARIKNKPQSAGRDQRAWERCV